ncbi:helix-turn-helix domain-containing protein [Cupriavidus metallidurans]|uniref:helix-turn-helix domain-containing protein n=1 Tax=Cupriavidus metallidurans TaxID=119219 RepID=UPI001CCB9593|nr:helix-turn-helix transcriptional regulator [Cupriavidus metallidurans]UBM11715.1 helix-turn-helix domain-containing protein [Cupriavidus metallidurans]
MNQSVSIGERLAEERKRKGLNQAAFAAIGGVSVKTQVLYEKAERVPDANYLAAIASAGFDVLYVITGAAGAAGLSAEEAAVMAGFRSLDARGRAGVLALISGMQAQPSGQTVKVKGSVGQYVDGDVTAPFTIDMRKTKK